MTADDGEDEEVSEPGRIINKPGIEIPLANNCETFHIPYANQGQIIIIGENEHMILDEFEYTTDSGSSFRNDNGIKKNLDSGKKMNIN